MFITKHYKGGVRISRSETIFTDVRFEPRGEDDRTHVNIPGYYVDNVTHILYTLNKIKH